LWKIFHVRVRKIFHDKKILHDRAEASDRRPGPFAGAPEEPVNSRSGRLPCRVLRVAFATR
jgi:hypothetical protein